MHDHWSLTQSTAGQLYTKKKRGVVGIKTNTTTTKCTGTGTRNTTIKIEHWSHTQSTAGQLYTEERGASL